MEPNTLWLLLTRGHIEQRESSKQESIIQRTKCQQIGNRTIRTFTSQLFETNTNALSSVCNGTSRFDHMLSPRIVAEETHLLGLELRNHTFLDWSIWNISVACCSLPTFLSGCQERHCAMNHCLLAGNESACLSCIFAVRCASVTAGSAVPGSKQSLAPVHIVMRGLLHSSPVGSSMLAALLPTSAPQKPRSTPAGALPRSGSRSHSARATAAPAASHSSTTETKSHTCKSHCNCRHELGGIVATSWSAIRQCPCGAGTLAPTLPVHHGQKPPLHGSSSSSPSLLVHSLHSFLTTS